MRPAGPPDKAGRTRKGRNGMEDRVGTGFLLREEWPLAARGKRPGPKRLRAAAVGLKGSAAHSAPPGKEKRTPPPDHAASIRAQRASRARDGSRMAETRFTGLGSRQPGSAFYAEGAQKKETTMGSIYLEQFLRMMVLSGKTEETHSEKCQGDEGSSKGRRPGPSCMNIFDVTAKISYRVKADWDGRTSKTWPAIELAHSETRNTAILHLHRYLTRSMRCFRTT